MFMASKVKQTNAARMFAVTIGIEQRHGELSKIVFPFADYCCNYRDVPLPLNQYSANTESPFNTDLTDT